MAARTYTARVIVLRKTRLREADLVLTMLAEDGSQVRAVARGALRPAGSFSSRLELYSCADVLLVEGRSLDIVREARIVDAHARLRFDFERGVCAAPMAELLALSTQDGLAVGRLFAMTQTALGSLEQADAANAPLVMTAFLLKAASLLGFRPSLARCCGCGRVRPADAGWPLSFDAGGVLCPDCAPGYERGSVSAHVVSWADALIRATFAEIGPMSVDGATLRELVLFAQAWTQAHIGRLKSLAFVLSDARVLPAAR